jgi:hypothetical protein
MNNFNKSPRNNTIENKNPLDIKKDDYLDLVNDFGYFVTLNASRLDQQVIPGKEGELNDLVTTLRKPIINNLNYGEFVAQHFSKLTDPTVSKTLILQIYNFLQYIEPRLIIFQADAPWVKRFGEIKEKYTQLVSRT